MKRVSLLMLVIVMGILLVPIKVYGLSTSITVSPSKITVGDTITVTVKFAQKIGCFDNIRLSYTGGVSHASGALKESAWYDPNGNVGIAQKTYKFKATKAGSATFNFTGSGFYDTSAENNLGSTSSSKTININAKATTTTTTTKPSTPATTTKSSNANLKSMYVNLEGLTPSFSKSQTAYSLKVGENTKDIKVTAAVENSKASYSVSGNKDLKVGENIVKVTVTAENGTKKVYKITVLKSDNPILSDATLANLIIEDANIGEFNPDITEYNAGNLKVISKLNILAYPNNKEAKSEIIGNANFVKGENKVTIRVTSANGAVKKDYTITFNNTVDPKSESSYLEVNPYVEVIGKDVVNAKSNGSKFIRVLKANSTIILLYLLALVEFAQVVYLYIQLKKVDPEKLIVKRRKQK